MSRGITEGKGLHALIVFSSGLRPGKKYLLILQRHLQTQLICRVRRWLGPYENTPIPNSVFKLRILNLNAEKRQILDNQSQNYVFKLNESSSVVEGVCQNWLKVDSQCRLVDIWSFAYSLHGQKYITVVKCQTSAESLKTSLYIEFYITSYFQTDILAGSVLFWAQTVSRKTTVCKFHRRLRKCGCGRKLKQLKTIIQPVFRMRSVFPFMVLFTIFISLVSSSQWQLFMVRIK